MKKGDDNAENPKSNDNTKNFKDGLHWKKVKPRSDILKNRRICNTVIVELYGRNFFEDRRDNPP